MLNAAMFASVRNNYIPVLIGFPVLVWSNSVMFDASSVQNSSLCYAAAELTIDCSVTEAWHASGSEDHHAGAHVLVSHEFARHAVH